MRLTRKTVLSLTCALVLSACSRGGNVRPCPPPATPQLAPLSQELTAPPTFEMQVWAIFFGSEPTQTP